MKFTPRYWSPVSLNLGKLPNSPHLKRFTLNLLPIYHELQKYLTLNCLFSHSHCWKTELPKSSTDEKMLEFQRNKWEPAKLVGANSYPWTPLPPLHMKHRENSTSQFIPKVQVGRWLARFSRTPSWDCRVETSPGQIWTCAAHWGRKNISQKCFYRSSSVRESFPLNIWLNLMANCLQKSVII